jgi:hypothetical protein
VTEPTPGPAAALPPAAARWIAGVLLIFYGFAKVTGAQFLVTDAELARPMGEVSGFWLTWYYFGFSTTYKIFIATAEIGGGALLLWPRSALAGALILLPVTVNIAVLDPLYGVDLGATIVSWVILGCLLMVLRPYLPRLRAAVLDAPRSSGTIGPRTRAALVSSIIAASAAFGWYARHHMIRDPSPIDGIWRVVADESADSTRTRWQQAFFELNRAHKLVLRAPGARDAVHRFEVDSRGTVRVWDFYDRDSVGAELMEGRIDPDGRIELSFLPAGTRRRMILERAPLRPPGGG